MEAKKETTTLPPIIDQIKEYAETRIKLAKYQAIEGGSSAIASIISTVAMAFCLLLTLVFSSFTLAFYLAEVFNSQWKGFGCVALLYLIIAFIVKAAKKSIEGSVIQAFISKLFKN